LCHYHRSAFAFFANTSAEKSECCECRAARDVSGAMCEDVLANAPRNPTIVFSITQKKAFCYSSFDQVPQKSVIYHNWFHRDVPSAKIRLILNPPRWASFSSIQLRKTDIGPWRVEITDEKGAVLGVLRFSVTD